MEGRSRRSSSSRISTSPNNHFLHHLYQPKKKQHHDANRTIKELTSNKKRLSDSNLSTNETIEFFTKIKNKRIKNITLSKNPNYNSYDTYNPYDRKKLLQRINSYNILNWSIEDTELTPLTCARFGWTCVENNGSIKNQLRCLTCDATMIMKLSEVAIQDVFDLDEDFEDDVNTELVQRYLARLATDHTESCPWKSHPAPMSSYSIHSYDYQDILNQLKKTLAALDDNKLYLQNKTFSQVIDDDSLNRLQKWTNFEYDNNVLMIGLLGWELKVQTFGYNQLVLLQCHCCNRRILIGNIKGGQVVQSDPTLNLTPSKILTGTMHPPTFVEEDEEELDVLSEHKDWCAIKNGYKTILTFCVL